jgi:MFS family permease
MQQKKSINFGFRGWMLILYQAIAFLTFLAFTNYPLNLLADMYGGAEKISTLYTVATIACIVIQLILARFIGRVKNVKKLGLMLGVISLVLAVCIMLVPPSPLWQVAYFLMVLIVILWCTFSVGILVGQWFPRRKGTVMGIATLAFPIGNGVMGFFAQGVFGAGGPPNVAGAFVPFLIIGIIGVLIGLFLIKDYPEQVGAFRDNDKDITPEVAKAMMEQEIEGKKTSVWTVGRTLKSREFWFIVLPMGFLLLSAVGMMTQTSTILGAFAEEIAPFGGFTGIMMMIAVLACVGSWLLGVLDTKFGTRRAIAISVIVMVVGGFAGMVHNVGCLLLALGCLAVFMGASSNFTVSAAAQYWRREDFPNVFAVVNPIANILQAIGPMMVAFLLFGFGPQYAFGAVGILGVVSVILIMLFKPSNIKDADDKYRTTANKPLDDALIGRK